MSETTGKVALAILLICLGLRALGALFDAEYHDYFTTTRPAMDKKLSEDARTLSNILPQFDRDTRQVP